MFCFPHAGGGASLFRTWSEALPPDIEVCGVQLPGRESRWKEPLIASIGTMIEALVPALQPWLDVPPLLYGHSMGSLLAFELARELRRRGLPQPRNLFVSGRRAPDIASPNAPIAALDEESFVAAIIRQYNGIPEPIRHDRELLRVFLPMLRADIGLIESYRWREEPPLECPISAFAGLDDPSVDYPNLIAWRRHTAGDFRLEFLAGGHFFPQTRRDLLLRGIARDLEGACAAPRAPIAF
jgi:medium-chain acyl-[acyl-carrier-protein] hydrolase